MERISNLVYRDVSAGVTRIWGGAGCYDANRYTYFVCAPLDRIHLGPMQDQGRRRHGVHLGFGINDGFGINFARWYGTGWTARGRIGNTTKCHFDEILDWEL